VTSSIRLLDLGFVSPLHSQTVYHAIGHAMSADSPDTIVLVSPDRPYVCVGYHQEMEKEVDLHYCRTKDLPVYRREVGGGAVYLDAGQLFTQWIFHEGRLPLHLEERFELYVRPLVETYRALGIPATYRPVNDIHVGGSKIGGTGAARIGGAEVVVGSFMFTFDKAVMAHVLRVRSEKMRDKVLQGLEQYMTTMQEQIGRLPERADVKRFYVERCAAVLGRDLAPGELTAAEWTAMEEIDARFTSDRWLHAKGGMRPGGVKIHEDVQVVEGAFKAPGGLIRATVRLHAGRIDGLEFSGDFTVFPALAVEALQRAAEGADLTHAALVERFTRTCQDLAMQSPGVTPDHWADAVLATAGASTPPFWSGNRAGGSAARDVRGRAG
jgi:lipoate-protein ligase A